MKFVTASLLAAGLLVSAPAMSFAHMGKGAVNEVDSAAGDYPTQTGHNAVRDAQTSNPTESDTDHANPHSPTPDRADPPGLEE